ncbi:MULTISPECIES: mechanosensitive ion channel family protein [unclassified Vibrio]|uniref:mechanosensitive ion channel family protein n=1 Tax=unclassified Vibrio TaxID=2614977 RepID=UPI0021D2EFF3|nr:MULTISPECIES: mechanosensitive ion channel family protein [unclassified Vibrio]MDW2064753.1 mechanosensitive ion channel family protein [Vibrio sp. 1579]MDW2255089.1 mechanosensitive ion channel family protein [Vibrio sp. 1569]MDW2328457.1 mechanosensitive ion channel family protein [Vibrio sp. 1401]HCE2598527.1 mechanosensitive ion channel family protein [Vibrio parahaemolyticus]
MELLVSFYETHQALILDIIQNSILTLLILVIASIASKLMRAGIQKAIMKVSNGDEIVASLMSKVGGYIVYILALVIILDLFGVNTTSLVALVGAAGLAIGLALKDTLSNIAAGIMILFLKPIKKGEFVEFAGYSGTVKDIGLFTSVFETGDGLYISSPNRTVWNATIRNFSRNGRRRMEIVVGISYEDSIETGLKVLQDLALSHETVMLDPKPQVMVQMLADSSVNLQLRAWCTTDKYWETYWSIQRQVKGKIEEAGMTIPFPQRDLHITMTQPQAQELLGQNKA